MPPLVFFVFLNGAGVLEGCLLVDGGDGFIGLRRLIAGPLMVLAGCFVIHAWSIFLKSGTHVDPRKPALKIVDDGPFRISRNPMYLSLAIIPAALSILHFPIWFLRSFFGLYL